MKERVEVLQERLSMKSWLLAARPKTLTAALAPIVVGTSLAKAEGYAIIWMLSLYALISSLCIQVATNLVNDALDFKKGADGERRIGPARVTQQGLLTAQQVLFAASLFFVAAFLFALPLILKGGWPLALVVSLSILSGYIYTGGPYPLAYKGLGDLFVIAFFGIAATCSVYYVQTLQLSPTPFLAGLQVGLLCTAMIAINNLRDREEDAKVGKRTLAVRFGVNFSRMEIALVTLLPFPLGLFWFLHGFPFAALLPAVTLPFAWRITALVWRSEPGRIYNLFLGLSALQHIAFSAFLSIGFFLQRGGYG